MISILKAFLQRHSEFPIPDFIWNLNFATKNFFIVSNLENKVNVISSLVWFISHGTE